MYDRVSSNIWKTWGLIFAFVVMVVGVTWAFSYFFQWGPIALIIAVVISLVMTWGSYFNSDKIAIAMSRAKPADPQRDRQLINIVESLAIGAGIPAPRVYIVEDSAPNAFATGRNPKHGAVAVTRGLLAKMSRDELEGVIAHELAHIKNRDTLVMTIAVTLVGIIVLLADIFLRAMWFGGSGRDDNRGGAWPIAVIGLILLIVAPIFAQLMQFAISRRREFLADAEAVLITRYPPGLIGALEKLKGDQTVVRTASRATAHLWIEEPIALSKAQGAKRESGAWLNRLFATHPPLDERIAALQSTLSGATPV